MSRGRPLDADAPRGPIAWMAQNPMAANLLMVLLLGGGVFMAVTMQKEVFPEFQLDLVSVSVGYPGAAPAEVEQGILRPVEEAVRGIEGIREITAEAREGSGSVSIELVGGADRMRAFQDVDQAVSRIRTFPDDIEQPVVSLRERRREVIEIGLYGDIGDWALRELAEQTRDQLLAQPGITQVELGRVPDYVTHVEIPRDRLREYGLTLPEVARAIADSSEDVAAGSVQTAAGEVLLRVDSRRQWAQQFAGLEIVSSAGGGVVRLGDIAEVRDGFAEGAFPSQFNQRPSVELNVYRVGSQSPLDVAEVTLATMAEIEPTLPEGVSWRVNSNSAADFGNRLSLVLKNALLAVVIVLVILALFLEFRLAFWAMLGMAISFVGGVLLLPIFGVSINMISLFGFLVVLGIVVDDAIVVGENVYEQRQTEPNAVRAAIYGAREMAGPVFFSVVSTIVAFVPLLFIPGETGNFWGPLSLVVIIVLAVSLFEALFILPSHLAHAGEARQRGGVLGFAHHQQQRFSRGFSRFVDTHYRRLLEACLRQRYVTTAMSLAIFIVVGGYATSAHMGMILMPEVSADEIEAGVRLPVGTTPRQAARVAEDVTRASLKMFDEHQLEDTAEGIKTNVRGGNFIDVEIVMRPPEERAMTADQVIELWRDSIGDLPGVDQITFEAEAGPGGARQDISVDLSHSDIDVLEQVTQALVQRVGEYGNTRDVSDNYNKGKSQIGFTLRPEARTLGFTAREVGEQLRGAFYGSLALRLLRGTNEVEVRVKLPEDQRQSMYNLENLVLRSPEGVEVPLLEVVEVHEGEAFSTISRRDGRRVVEVSMDVEPKRAVGQVIAALREVELPALREQYPGLTWSFEGSDADLREATATLWGGFGLALAVIYALLAIAFNSYLQPIIVLLSIPFGIVGAVVGHIMLGYDLSLISLMGVIALSGVVVNDALIMISHANRHRRGDQTAHEAILDAGLRRFRPIVLTTLTTFGGLAPLIFETSLQAQYIIPMAISLGFGIVCATAIILLLIPSLYLILEDAKNLTRRVGSKG